VDSDILRKQCPNISEQIFYFRNFATKHKICILFFVCVFIERAWNYCRLLLIRERERLFKSLQIIIPNIQLLEPTVWYTLLSVR
jgi:hypothetical protein